MGYELLARPTGTTSGTVAAGDDPRIVSAASQQLATGEETMPRELLTNSTIGQSSGQIRLTFFTARKTETSTQCRLYSGATLAAPTPTLCRIGIWEVDASDNGTLVASTTSDTTLYAAATTAYVRSWTTPFTKTAGKRYAFGTLVVTAATPPTFGGHAIIYIAEPVFAPRMGGLLTGQSDLPSSFSAGSLVASGARIYAAILP